jgi:two-component system NtrC family sensor kinase
MTAPKIFSRRVLVIDDMESIQRDFGKALNPVEGPTLEDIEGGLFGAQAPSTQEDIRFDVSYASQGMEGVEAVGQALLEKRPYALAFVDVRMPPGLDGIETIVRLWDVDPRLEVVICTAYSDYTWGQMLERLARRAQFLVLTKPFDSTVVKQMALSLTEKWNLTRAAERSNDELEALVLERTHQLSHANDELTSEIEERGKLERRIRHAQKLEALGRLVGGVAHEINNPLTVVLANLDHIQHELTRVVQGIDTRIQGLMAVTTETQDAGRRIQQIVRDLRAFSQQEERRVEDINLPETLGFAVRLAKSSFPESLVVSTHFDGGLPSVSGSPDQLLQIFLNLLVNAAQAMASVPKERRRLEVSVRRSVDSRVVIAVTDHGVGIRPEDLPRVFDPFYTTRGIGSGTGLGLSICHGFVEQLGGEISIESTLGEGTVATVLLPARPQQLLPTQPNLPRLQAGPVALDAPAP